MGKTHAELADRIAGPKPKAPAPTIAEPEPGTVQLSAAEHQAHVAERETLNREALRIQTLKADVTKMLRDRFPLSDYTKTAS